MTPASLAIIEAAFQPADRTHAIGTWAGFSGVSAAIAPFLGGWLLEAGSWRWIFLINVPVAAVTAWTTRRHVPESRDTSSSGSADWPGALAGVAALATTTYAIIVLPGAGALAAVRRCPRCSPWGPGPRSSSPNGAAAIPCSRRRSSARRVPRRERRHLRRQRRPRRLRVRLHPRPGDHRRLQPGGGGLGAGAGHRRDLAAVGSQRPAGSADRPPAATGGGLPAVRGRVHARRAHRPPRRLLDGRIPAGRAVRPRPGRPPATPDRQRDELRPRLPGRSRLRGEQRRGAGGGPALDRRAAAHHRPHRRAPTPTRRSSSPASPRSAGSARPRSPAPRCSPPPSSPGLRRPTPHRRLALIQTPVPHLACPVALHHTPRRTRKPNSSQPSDPSSATDTPLPSRPPDKPCPSRGLRHSATASSPSSSP